MKIELAATHEAGHGVVQWLVGWELYGLEMTVKDGEATKVRTDCPRPSVGSKSALRKRLIMLFAGREATQKPRPGSTHDKGDWIDACMAAAEYFGLKNVGGPEGTDRVATQPEPNEAIQDAIAKSAEIVRHPTIEAAIEKIAFAFLAVPLDEAGKRRLEGGEVFAICEELVGNEFRLVNRWSEWMAGK